MVETYQSHTRFEDRKSQHLGFGDYLKEAAWNYLPTITSFGALAIGMVTKHKYFPLDGSPSLFQHGADVRTNKGFKKALGTEITIDEVQRLWFFTKWFSPENQVNAAKNFWNFMKGAEVALPFVAYHHWRKGEKKRLDLTDTYESLTQLNDLKPTDAELAAENASLKQQLAFVEAPHGPKPQLHASTAEHAGTLQHAPQQHRA